MKKTMFSLLVCFVLSGTVLAGTYREFINQDGKSIHARILEYDAGGDRVLLELKNRKKAWVHLSDLSESDQVYIQQYTQTKANLASENAKPEPVKKRSKKELEAIGEQYIQAWESGDIELLRAFFLHPERITQRSFNDYNEIIDELDVDEVGAGYILLDVDRKNDKVWLHYTDHGMKNGDERWLLFTPDGKVKYDSILLKHPILIAMKSVRILLTATYSEELQNRIYASLEQTGVPLFGLDPSKNPRRNAGALLELLNWIQEEGHQWDASEPKVFFPKELLEYI